MSARPVRSSSRLAATVAVPVLAALPLAIPLALSTALLVAVLGPGASQAQETRPRPASTEIPRGTTPVKAVVAMTQERQAAAVKFAELHHPELSELLTGLERRNPREYEKAIRQLFVVSDRLARLKARDEVRYELQLEMWKLDSRIQLLAARLVMDPGGKHEAELRSLVEQRLDLRLRQLELDRDQLAERLQKVESTIGEVTADRDAAVERELRRIRSTLKNVPRNPNKS